MGKPADRGDGGCAFAAVTAKNKGGIFAVLKPMIRKAIWIVAAGCVAVSMVFSACVKERFDQSPEASIRFELDTLRFDTVFTSIGSATRLVKVYNPNELPVIVDRIELEAGPASRFRFNIDGYRGPVVERLEIGGEDSTYLFVEVTVDPDQPLSVSPFVLEERMRFSVNGNTEWLHLEAWGQNANYIPSRFGKNGVALLSCDFGEIEWSDPRPYVIYGILVVEACNLVWPAGTRVYVHGGIARSTDVDGNRIFYNDGLVFVAPTGRLLSAGTAADPVRVSGDRLEPVFAEIPGQWQGIRFDKGSRGNVLRHTRIENGTYGLFVDSTAQVRLEACEIRNTSGEGLLAFHGEIEADNCLFADNGTQSFGAVLGGRYRYRHCTFANFGNDQPAVAMNGFYCYDQPNCNVVAEKRIDAEFVNCVITGSNRDEFWVTPSEQEGMTLRIDHGIVRVDELLEPNVLPDFLENYTVSVSNRQRTDSLFADLQMGDYRPDTLSVLEGRGRALPEVPLDLSGNERDMSMPDLGCYEYRY